MINVLGFKESHSKVVKPLGWIWFLTGTEGLELHTVTPRAAALRHDGGCLLPRRLENAGRIAVRRLRENRAFFGALSIIIPDRRAERRDGQMMQMLTGFCMTQIAGAVATYSIADHLAKGPATAEQIAAVEGIDSTAAFRSLRACASLGLVITLSFRSSTDWRPGTECDCPI
jgi:hypothetical protein